VLEEPLHSMETIGSSDLETTPTFGGLSSLPNRKDEKRSLVVKG